MVQDRQYKTVKRWILGRLRRATRRASIVLGMNTRAGACMGLEAILERFMA